MKSIRIAGLCLAAMFVMSMVAAGTASAAPHWLVCLKWNNSPTRYATSQCEKAETGGGFEWSELKGTEATVTQGTLILETSNVPIVGEVVMECSGTDEGSVGPGNQSRTTVVTTTTCTAGKNCEKVEKKAEAVNLPWNTELLETEGVIHGTIRKGAGAAGPPGWRATCKVLGTEQKNECTSEAGLLLLSNKNTPGVVGPLLVLADFEHPNKTLATCTVSGTKGDVLGSIAILLKSGSGTSSLQIKAL